MDKLKEIEDKLQGMNPDTNSKRLSKSRSRVLIAQSTPGSKKKPQKSGASGSKNPKNID